MANDITTYGQFVEARELSEILMKKYAQEISQGRRSIFDGEDVDQAFRDVAKALGYKVEKIEASVEEAA